MMLERIFSLTQQQNEKSLRFLVRVGVRVFLVVTGLAVFTFIILSFIAPFLFSFESPMASFAAGFLVLCSVLSVGVAALGGVIALIQIAWRVGTGRKLMLSLFPNLFGIFVLVILGTVPAYLAVKGLMSGSIGHLSHRIKEQYLAGDDPLGYWVHLSLHAALSTMMYWYALKRYSDLKHRYHTLKDECQEASRRLKPPASPE